MSNTELFNHLDTIAKLKVLAGANQFSVASYERAAKAVRDSLKQLTASDIATFKGVGKKIAKTAEEFLESGTSTTYKELAAKVPVECLTMTKVAGIGAVRAYKIYQLGVRNFDELVALAEKNQLDEIVAAKIGAGSVEDFKKAILFARDTAAGRLPYETARFVADAVLKPLLEPGWIQHVDVLGSLRRKKSTIKDIDIGVCCKKSTRTFPCVFKLLEESGLDFGVVNQGENKASLRVRYSGVTMACDIWAVEKFYWGSFLNYATGSKQHNIWLRSLAQKNGLTISEYGIFKLGTKNNFKKTIKRDGRVVFIPGMGERLGGENEVDLYRVLGLEYVQPENRE